jgi:glucose uptake protein
MLWVGCASVLAAIVFDVVAWSRNRAIRAAEAQAAAAALAAEQPTEGKTAIKGKKPSRKKQSVRKSVFLAVLGGILLGSFSPLVGMAEEGENGIGPYTVAFLFGLAVAFSTFAYNLFFMNLPVQGKPVEVSEFFNGAPKQHLKGILGGLIWAVGLVAILVAGKAEPAASAAPALVSALGYCIPLVGAAWGLVVWKEYSGAENSIKMLLAAMFVLFAAGTAMVSLAPVFGIR